MTLPGIMGAIAAAGAQEPAAETTYADEVLADGPIAYWRLGENSGADAADEQGNHDGTYGGTFTLDQPGLIDSDPDRAVDFNVGRVELVDAAAWDVTDCSIEAWIKTSTNDFQQIMARDNPSETRVFQFRVNASSQNSGITFNPSPGSGNLVRYEPGAPGLHDGNIHHIVATFEDGVEMKIYVDGVEVASEVPNVGLPAEDYAPTIADRFDGAFNNEPFIGILDEVAFYNYALSETRIQAHYNKGAP